MGIEYPKQVFCQWGNKVNVNCEFGFEIADEKSGIPPMQMHKGNLSRFPITIIDVSKGSPRVVTGNIPWTDISGIREKTRRAGILIDQARYGMLNHASASAIAPAQAPQPASSAEGQTPENTGFAYSTVFRFGPFNGKSPAQVLMEGVAQEKLLSTKAFLERNLTSYPENANVMKGIDEAIALQKTGKLTSNTSAVVETAVPVASAVAAPAQGLAPYIVYERQYKNKKPFDEQFRTVYGIKIECSLTPGKYPWKLSINNCMAPGRINSQGVWTPVMEKARDKLTLSINLSDDAWIESADIMYRRLCQFEQDQFRGQYERLKKLSWAPPKVADAEGGPVTLGQTGDGGLTIGVGAAS